MLHTYDPSEPIWFGCKYHPYVEQGYMSGGAGYVLSRGALDKFVNSALTDKVSISSTFYVHIFHTNIILAAFSSYVLALAKKLYKKCARIMLMKLIKGSNWLSCR
jgi:hypothetical protein